MRRPILNKYAHPNFYDVFLSKQFEFYNIHNALSMREQVDQILTSLWRKLCEICNNQIAYFGKCGNLDLHTWIRSHFGFWDL